MTRHLHVIFIAFCCVFLNASVSFSQQDKYWNGWINYSQKYYKIPVAKNGIYRLTIAQLSGAGIPVSGIDSRSFQLYFRGQEQFIFVEDVNQDDTLNGTDYIEFYGQKNDGSLDSTLYKGLLYNKAVRQPNPYYSLFSDTSAYFLTWKPGSLNNKRITLSSDTVLSSVPNQTPYFMKQELMEYHDTYYYGSSAQYNINFPDFNEVEGWAGINFYPGNHHSAIINTTNRYPSAQDSATLKIAVMGCSNDVASSADHEIQISYTNASATFTQLDHQVFDGYLLLDSVYPIPVSALGGSTEIRVTALNVNATSRNAVPYVIFKYPHNLNLENKNYFELYVPEDKTQSHSKFAFTNINTLATTVVYLYDLTDHRKIPLSKNGNVYNALVKNSGTPGIEKFCVVKTETQFITPWTIIPVGTNGSFTNYANLNLDSAFIIVTHKKLMGSAIAYENYRKGPTGGSHDVLTVDVDDLYDQFGYGIPKYPFAIRHFAHYALDSFPTPPQNLFLLGKGIQTNLTRNGTTFSDPKGENYPNSFVPSIGFPTCDNMLVAMLNGDTLTPAIPIGRLAAKDSGEVMTYLKKVNEYENISPNPDEWMKHIIHMGGGSSAQQSNDFKGYLQGYEKIIKDTLFGGFVHHFTKNSSSPTQTSYTDSIKGLINSGISLITFFGHTSASVFEFNLLPPSSYSNSNGKYPFFIADGCVAGDIFQPEQGGISLSEIYTMSNQGMIGFLASSGLGTAYHLDVYTKNLYKAIGRDLYGKSIGKCIQAAVDATEDSATDPYLNAACLEMTLHGDPSIGLHSSLKPDYEVKTPSVSFDPPVVSTDMTSFKVKVAVANIGKAVNDSVLVSIKRIFNDGTAMFYSDTLPYVHFKDTATFILPVDPIHGPGLNTFEVRVDSIYAVDEANEQNNDLLGTNAAPLFIYSGDVIPVYPYEYAIVPNDSITLKAYTSDPFAKKANYIFEIDTTDRFDTPHTQYVTQMGAVLKAPYNTWAPSLALLDSTVYFWRVRRDTSDTTFRWRESSFEYRSGKRGWGQSHFFQFLKGDRFSYVDTTRSLRLFELEKQKIDLTIETRNLSAWGAPFAGLVMCNLGNYNAYKGTDVPASVPHVIISVVDPISGDLWYNTGFQYGSQNGQSQGSGSIGYEFNTVTQADQDTLENFLKNVLPCGSKVAIYTCGVHNLGSLLNATSPTQNSGLVAAFQSVGGSQFSALLDNRPYGLIGRKCGTAIEGIGSSDSAFVNLKDSIGINRQSGSIYSEIIGPASKWKSLHWKSVSPEAGNPAAAGADTIVIRMVGFNKNGSTDTIFKAITKDSLDILNLDQTISAATYPYLQLTAWVKDTLLRTPAQLKFWRLYYDGVPDASLNPAKQFSFYAPVVQQGDNMSMSVAVENIGDYDMDSIWVKFWVYDANRNYVFIDSMKMDSLPVDSIVVPKIKFPTIDLPGGLSSLWVEANPFNSQHQLEQYHFNNIGTIPFTVNEDNINPVLDVTFDGVHIMNGDLVSAKPTIVIKLKDENTFLALNDQNDFEVRLQRPGKSTYDTVSFGNSLVFDPAVLPNNSCRLLYTPTLPDGVYNLKVQGTDRSGNMSGNIEYKITFEVINKPTITSVLNYPNPFSTSTKFVFTLTGSEVPDYFKIQILTITGKIVRELNKYDLGPIHIGRNITEYAWDGKDDFGDQLANGLYLYRVLTQLNGKSLEHRDTEADPYFTQGYGKMYLIR